MSTIQIGDKVRFLNSVGGGIVKRFISKEVVSVEEPDGFETPILVRECVWIESSSDAKLQAEEKHEKTTLPTAIKPAEVVKKPVKETLEGEKITLALAYMPLNIKTLQTTSYECYLVNDSNYHLTFAYFNQVDTRWNLRMAGSIEPHQHLFVEEFTKEDLNSLERIAVQYMPFKTNKPFELKQPGSMEYRFDVTKFYKLHAFRPNDYFEDDAIIVPVVIKDRVQSSDPLNAIDTQALAKAMLEKQQDERPVRRRVSHPSTQENKPLEIDLHIHELIDTTTGMNNAAILECQLAKVEEVMQTHRKQIGKRIVFIHGKGEGVLRNAVLKLLKERYAKCQTQDASFHEYGFGATLVVVR